MKRGAAAESRDRGGIWDPEVQQLGGERRKSGGGGRQRGRGGLGDGKDSVLGLGEGWGGLASAQCSVEPGEREVEGAGRRADGRQVPGREDAEGARAPVGSAPRAGRRGRGGRPLLRQAARRGGAEQRSARHVARAPDRQ